MLRSIEQKILHISKAAGVEIISISDEKLHINTVIVQAKNNSVLKTDSYNGLEQLKLLPQKINTKIPLSLVFNGQGVLIKKVSSTSNISISSVLPNIKPEDFYYESFQTRDLNIISIVRKEHINKIISELKTLGYNIISISLGFTSIEKILPFINTDGGNQLEMDSIILQLDADKGIVDFRNKEEINHHKFQPKEYLVANQYIKPANLLAFATATGLLADDITSANTINSQALNEERKEFYNFRLFRFTAIGILAILFSILLLNFTIYNHYFNKNRSLETSQVFIAQQEQKYQALKKEITRKEKFLGQSGWTTSNSTSFFADRIASLTPAEVLLTSIQIYPARNTTFSNSGSHLFKKDTILITGVCENPIELNNLMNNLKIVQEFKKIEIKSYQIRNEEKRGSFSMEIITK